MVYRNLLLSECRKDYERNVMKAAKQWAHRLKTKIKVIAIAFHDPRTPWAAKLLAGIVTGYALSPIDLIPDFIPILGYLDDLILVPLGVALVLRLIPPDVLKDAEAEALRTEQSRAKNWTVGILIIGIWLAIALFLTFKLI